MTLGLLVPVALHGESSGRKPAKPVRVFLFGIDGATWKVIGPMLEAGELPAFRRLMTEGAYMPQFETMGTTSSPLVWTSVATGVVPERHGISDFSETLPSGKIVPITSNRRQVKALWNIATENGLTTGVIGWWASWPVETIAGYIISDHANPAAAAWMTADQRLWTVDPAKLKEMQRDASPADLLPLLQEHWLDKETFPWQDFHRRSRLNDEQLKLLRQAPWYQRTPYSWLKTFYAVDYPHFTLARQLVDSRPTDLLMLYLRGPDPLQHYAWHLVEPEAYRHVPETLERDRGIVEGVYRYLDSFVGEILESKHPDTTLIVASDHGSQAKRSYGIKPGGRSGRHGPNAKGVLFVHGPQVKKGHRLTRGSPLDLMPTMAWLLGLPIAEGLDGEILFDAFEDRFVKATPVERIATYGGRETSPGLESPIDEALLEQLRSLGYID